MCIWLVVVEGFRVKRDIIIITIIIIIIIIIITTITITIIIIIIIIIIINIIIIIGLPQLRVWRTRVSVGDSPTGGGTLRCRGVQLTMVYP